MANTTLQIKRTSISGRVPKGDQIDVGELAINLADAKLFSKDGANTVIEVGLGSKGDKGQKGDPGPVAGSNTQIIYNNNGAAAGSSDLRWDGATLYATTLKSTQSSGDEGGQIDFALAANTSLSGTVAIDVYQNKLRIFETGGTNRGAYLDFTSAGNGVSTNLLSSGSKGEKGDTGSTGAKGDKGVVGDKGATGDKGDPGATGSKGDKGDTGATGASGDKGQKGDTGTTGDKGNTGDIGDKGQKGEIGSKGDTGSSGTKGDKGDQGQKGDAGTNGSKGDKGDTGATGDKGVAGATGDKGNTGDKGQKGDTGATGAKGDKGDTGTTGVKGDTGSKGDKGDTGSKGDKGDAGSKGDKGDVGPVGGSNTQIVFNDSGSANGSGSLVFDKSVVTLYVGNSTSNTSLSNGEIVTLGKAFVGQYANNRSISNTAVTAGNNAARALNLVDSVAVIKVARVNATAVNGPGIDLQRWSTDADASPASYYDIAVTSNTLVFRDRTSGTNSYLIIQANGAVTLPYSIAIGEAASNILANSTVFKIGSSTINATINSTALDISNSTSESVITVGNLKLGNSTVNLSINATAVALNGNVGTNGQVLSSNGTGVVWSSTAGAKGDKGDSSVYQIQEFTATAGQSTFTFTSAIANIISVSVFQNGIRLPATDYTVNTTVLTLGAAAALNDDIAVSAYINAGTKGDKGDKGESTLGIEQFTASNSQTTFTLAAPVSNIVSVFKNGVLLANADVTTNTTAAVLTTAAVNNDIVTVHSVGVTGTKGEKGDNSVGSSSNTFVLFNDSLVQNGVSSFTFNKTTYTLFVSNTIQSNLILTAGNTTVNTTINSTALAISNSTLTSSVRVDTISLGNTATNTVINTTAAVIGGNTLTVGTTAYITSTGLGIGVASPSAVLDLKAGNTTVAPIEIASGTVLTSPVAGTIEYDGIRFFGTTDTTSGRGFIPSYQYRRLSANGAAIGSTIASFFGASSAMNLAAGGIYELTAYCYFLKTTAGTVTVTLTHSQSPVSTSGTVDYGAATGGTATGAANRITVFNSTANATAFGASASLTTAVNHVFIITAVIAAHATLPSTLTINFTEGAGTVTPLIGSYYMLNRLPSANVGTFA